MCVLYVPVYALYSEPAVSMPSDWEDVPMEDDPYPDKKNPHTQQQQEAAEPESACSDHFSDPSAQVDSTKYASTSLTLCTLNVRGMHSSITDVIMILRNKERIPDILALTETKHSHINSLWRITLQQYKLHHNVPEINPETNRRSAGTVLAINKTKFTSSTSIDVPSHLTGYLTAAVAVPYARPTILAVALYMPQLNSPSTKSLYGEILDWIKDTTELRYPKCDVYIGGDFQASPDPTSRSYYAPLNTLTALTPLNDPKVPTFQPARTALDHWLARSGQVQSKYSTHISHSVCSDHSAVIIRIQVPGIYLPRTDDPINTQPSATTRTSPPFQLPVDKTNIQLYQLGNQELRTQTASIRREIDSLTAMTEDRKLDISTIDSLAEDIMGLISEYYTLATQIWPTHQTSHYTTTVADTASPQRHNTSLLKPPMTKSALRSIRRLSRLGT